MKNDFNADQIGAQETTTIPAEMVQRAINGHQKAGIPPVVKVLAALGVFFLLLSGGFAAWM